MRALFICTILGICFAVVSAIKCYNCDSLHDPRCNQYFSPEGVEQVDCDELEMPKYLEKYERRLPATGCMTKIHEGVEGYRFFIRRTCYYGDIDNTEEACEAEDPYVFFRDTLSCDVCNDDLCNTNTATKTSAGAMAVIITIFGTYLLGL
ncbi:uncharacterized protein LOC119690125 [Teleopsis dalmanni]|uniref:uncharacterized protein LOC119690125 n=1 Tax=Teleopsis dalmanni TaxID=139649 RepID=UPI0018CCA46A|nr:uncharacterized protein LOC119690125 [Teleopsis dalmanni]